MLLQFLNYHTKIINCILSILLATVVWENILLEGKRRRRRLSLSDCVLSALAPLPIIQPVWGLWKAVLQSLKKKNLCSFRSINITSRNCIYSKMDLMYRICLLLPLLIIWLCRWPLVRFAAIISRTMAFARKNLNLLLEFQMY